MALLDAGFEHPGRVAPSQSFPGGERAGHPGEGTAGCRRRSASAVGVGLEVDPLLAELFYDVGLVGVGVLDD
jgi:hypothetical protein